MVMVWSCRGVRWTERNAEEEAARAIVVCCVCCFLPAARASGLASRAVEAHSWDGELSGSLAANGRRGGAHSLGVCGECVGVGAWCARNAREKAQAFAGRSDTRI